MPSSHRSWSGLKSNCCLHLFLTPVPDTCSSPARLLGPAALFLQLVAAVPAVCLSVADPLLPHTVLPVSAHELVGRTDLRVAGDKRRAVLDDGAGLEFRKIPLLF